VDPGTIEAFQLPVDVPEPVVRATPIAPTVTVRSLPTVRSEPLPPDDAVVVAELRDLAATDPEQSLKLARGALERNPRGASAAEFEWNVVKALFNMGDLEAAQDEARVMVRDFPDSELSGDVVRHVLDPQPNP
jgi:hypothetical protein